MTSGAFTLKANPTNLLLRVSSIGYATIYNKVRKSDLGVIQLLPDAQLLGEVVVKGDLPKVQLKGDAQVTNVQGTILEKAGTGNDLLSKLPGVSAEEGTVNVFGSGTAEIFQRTLYAYQRCDDSDQCRLFGRRSDYHASGS